MSVAAVSSCRLRDMALRRKTLTIPEAADLLGIPHSTAYDHVRKGTFAVPVISSGKIYRVRRDLLEGVVGPINLPDEESCEA